MALLDWSQRPAVESIPGKLAVAISLGIICAVAPIGVVALTRSLPNEPLGSGLTPASQTLPATPDRPTFEVASIRTASAAQAGGEVLGSTIAFQPGGRFVARHVSLWSLMIYAYRGEQFTLRQDQIVGGPSWLTSPLFDIDAKVEGDRSPGRIPMVPTGAALLRSLLEDRFKLKVRTESRPMRVYALLLARSDGTLGPQLRPSLVDCSKLIEASQGNPPVPLPPPPAGRPQCGISFKGLTSLAAGGTTLDKIVPAIANAVRNIVVDRTGLTGDYDVELSWRPERLTNTLVGAPGDSPSMFTAVQEQLGLKLELRNESVDVVVIDHVERPTDN